MKYVFTATALLLGSALAHAQSAHWTFTYTGFYDQEAAVFLPDMQIAGSFTGTDLDPTACSRSEELSFAHHRLDGLRGLRRPAATPITTAAPTASFSRPEAACRSASANTAATPKAGSAAAT
jgi:hypothetical protein